MTAISTASKTSITIGLLVLACGTLPTTVHGHGKLLQPASVMKPQSVSPGQVFDYVGEIDGSKVYPKYKWGGQPQANQKQLAAVFTDNGFSTLREFLDKHEKDMIPFHKGKGDNVCGFTDPNAAPMDLPADGNLQWGHTTGRWGFQPTHNGPCEVWCDDEMVQANADCLTTYGAALPAKIPIDVAKCKGKKMLRFMWLAVHFTKWQYWFNCIPLKQDATAAPTAAPTDAPATNAPSPSSSVVATPVPSQSGSVSPSSSPSQVPSLPPSYLPSKTPVPQVPAGSPASTPAGPVPSATPRNESASSLVPSQVPAPVPAQTPCKTPRGMGKQ